MLLQQLLFPDVAAAAVVLAPAVDAGIDFFVSAVPSAAVVLAAAVASAVVVSAVVASAVAALLFLL